MLADAQPSTIISAVLRLDRPFELLARAAPRRSVWLGLPLLLYAWSITGPFVCDDLNLLLKAERYIRGESDRLDLFRFAPTDEAWRQVRDRGTWPWWSPEGKRIDFLRPLAELSFYLDVRLFARSATGHRLVSLGWFALALVCLHRLCAAAGRDPVRAGVATLFFGISQAVTAPATFISNRSDLLVLVSVTLAGWAYWRAGRPADSNPLAASRKPNWWLVGLATASFAFALLAKEIAVALAGVIVAHELLARWRRFPLPGGPTRGTIAGIIFVLSVVYLGYYVASRPWAFGLGEYATNRPSLLGDAPRSALLYLAAWTLGFPISVLLQAGAGHVAAVTAAAAIAALVVGWYLIKTVRGDRAAAFFGLWTAMFLLPALLTIPETRALSLATAGWAYLLAGLLTRSERGAAGPLWLRHWLLTANGAISVACAIGAVLFANSAEKQARTSLGEYLAAFESPLQDGDTVVVAEPRSPLEFLCAGDRLEFMTGRRNVALAFLTVADTATSFEREDAHTLLLSAPDGSLLASPMHRVLLGDDWEPAVGDQFRLTRFTAEIAEVSDRGAVTAVRFRFEQPLASPRLHFYPPDLARVARQQSSTQPAGSRAGD
jgi:hypothetical protein